MSQGGRDPDLVAIAVPIRDARNRVFGAMGVSSATTRLTPPRLERTRRLLLREAAALHSALAK
jgi:DNA-binding IclR family transcriptional regulator